MRKKDQLTLTREQRESAANLIKTYIDQNFDEEISNFQAEIFVDYITEKIGSYYYNKAVEDAIAYMTEKSEELCLLTKDEL